MAISLTQMHAADKAPAKSVDELRRFEATAIEERIAEQSVYELVCSAAEAWGEATFISFLEHGLADDEPRSLSFIDAKRQITQAANAFRDLGVGRNDAVGFLVPNLPETYLSLLAASTAGRANPVNPLLSVEHITNIMRAAGVRVIVTVSTAIHPDLFGKAKEVARALADGVTIVTLDAPEDGASLYARLIDAYAGDRLETMEAPTRDDIAGAFHTGGTTSAPKLIAMTHHNELATTCMGLLGSGYAKGDVSLGGLPSYHVIAGIATPLISLASGATILLCGPFGFRNPFMIADFWKIVARHRVSTAAVVPTVLSVLKDIPVDHDISSLRQIVSGAAPLPVALIDAIVSKTGAEIVETYGMTEASTFCARNPPGGEKRAGSVGPFMPYQEARIVENTDGQPHRDVERGKVGKIVLRGPNVVVSTAFVDESGTAMGEERVDEDGWLDTGDLGYLDDDGYLWLQGRAKDLIIRSGHNIDPRLIEETLARHPAVNMVAAVGQPDGYAGEIPVAYVTLGPGEAVSGDELQAFAKERVSERPAAPSRVEILDAMPLTTIGKIYKPALRARAAKTVATGLLKAGLPDHGDLAIDVRDSAPGARRAIEIGVKGLSAGEYDAFTARAAKELKSLNFEPLITREVA